MHLCYWGINVCLYSANLGAVCYCYIITLCSFSCCVCVSVACSLCCLRLFKWQSIILGSVGLYLKSKEALFQKKVLQLMQTDLCVWLNVKGDFSSKFCVMVSLNVFGGCLLTLGGWNIKGIWVIYERGIWFWSWLYPGPWCWGSRRVQSFEHCRSDGGMSIVYSFKVRI